MTKTFRTLLFLVVVATVGLGTGPAQKAGLLYVVVVMEGYNIRLQPQINGLRDGLEELKYVEGENLKWQRIEGGTSGGAPRQSEVSGRKTTDGRISDPRDHGNQPCKRGCSKHSNGLPAGRGPGEIRFCSFATKSRD